MASFYVSGSNAREWVRSRPNWWKW